MSGKKDKQKSAVKKTNDEKEKSDRQMKTEIVPPDGGWGWVIVVAFALGNIVIIPIFQNFGLIFKDKLKDLKMSGTDIATIINVNASFGMLMGLVNGSLLKKFGYRKIAVVGVLNVFFGVVLTAYMDTFIGFFMTYGIITSLGFGMAMAALSLAVNTYFRKKRSFAMAFGSAGMGLGPIFMPLVISAFLEEYGISGTMLIVGALSLNAMISACLLQPVEWHLKEIPIKEEEMQIMNDSRNNMERQNSVHSHHGLRRNSIVNASTFSLNFDGETVSVFETTSPVPTRKFSNAGILKHDHHEETIMEENVEKIDDSKKLDVPNGTKIDVDKPNGIIAALDEKEEVKGTRWDKFLSFLDVDLLRDPKFVILTIGMSIAICAEMNFSLLTPFILNDFGFSTHETAQVMAVLALADITFRLLAPFVLQCMKKSVKIMYCMSLVMLIATRTSMIFVRGYWELMLVALSLGISKGFRTVYMSLLVPCYVPLDKLANASGLQMMVNGIIILICGPLLGLIRDITGSYTNSIYVINLITFTTIFMWTIEAIYYKFCKKR